MDGRFETYIRPHRGFAAAPTQRRPDTGRRRMAVCRVRGEQEGRRGKLPEDARAGAGVRRPCARRQARGARSAARPCRTSSASPTARAGRWSATPATTRTPITAQGITDAFRDAERCADGARPGVRGTRAVRRGDGRLPARRATSTRCRCTSSPASSRRWSRRRPRCSSCSARSTATRKAMDGFAQMNAGTISPARVLLAGEHRRDHGRCADRGCPLRRERVTTAVTSRPPRVGCGRAVRSGGELHTTDKLCSRSSRISSPSDHA